MWTHVLLYLSGLILGGSHGKPQLVVDLCGIFNTCNKNEGRASTGEEPVYIGKWLESKSLNNEQIYLFADDVGTKNWFEAEEYCHSLGGFLAEPLNEAESNFLRDQANRFSEANWWLGLRETETCECLSFGRPTTKFDAIFDSGKALDRSDNGLVKLTCPPNFQKTCNGNRQWRWGLSGQKVGYSYWNGKTGEPNGPGEHCGALWFKAPNNEWVDWSCLGTIDSGKQFRPLCQKNKDIIDFGNETDDEDDYEDYNEEQKEPNTPQLQCVDFDRRYPLRKSNLIDRILQVSSYEDCRKRCNDNLECNHWVWTGHRSVKSCILGRELRRSNNGLPIIGAVSGTMENGCRKEPSTDLKPKDDYCVEYGAIYGFETSTKIATIKDGMDIPEDCRQKCLQNNECVRYSWVRKRNKKRRGGGGRRRNRPRFKKPICILLKEGPYETFTQITSISGHVQGKCRDSSVLDLDSCQCHQPLENAGNLRIVNEIEEILGSTDENSAIGLPTLIDIDFTKCQKTEVVRCSKSSEPLVKFTKGEYCVDYDVSYEDGDEIAFLEGISSPEDCRLKCLRTNGCRFYSWFDQECSLMSSKTWIPAIDKGSVSGTIDGQCRSNSISLLGFCDCQEVDDEDYSFSDGAGLIDVRNTFSPGSNPQCPENQGKRCYFKIPKKPPVKPVENLVRGDYCVDYHIFYEDGDEIAHFQEIFSGADCRAKCLQTTYCRFYSWFDGECSLMSSKSWIPAYEEGSVSGTVDGPCRDQGIDNLGFCDCQEVDYEDDTFTDGAGLIDIKNGLGGSPYGCPENQGKRCYAKIKAGSASPAPFGGTARFNIE